MKMKIVQFEVGGGWGGGGGYFPRYENNIFAQKIGMVD